MSRDKVTKIVGLVIVIALIGIGVVLWSSQANSINSFEKCKAAGNPILESYPEQCMTPDGKIYARPFEVGDQVTYVGTLVCLPHKNTSGPVTLECAYGLQTNDGNYHGLKDQNQTVFGMNINDSVSVTGKIVTNDNEIYNIVDTVEVSNVTKI